MNIVERALSGKDQTKTRLDIETTTGRYEGFIYVHTYDNVVELQYQKPPNVNFSPYTIWINVEYIVTVKLCKE